MSVRRLDPEQPADFAFTAENLAWAEATIAKFPKGKQASAVIALLWRAQEQHSGWLPEPAIRYIADMLGMAQVRVLEIATFYTMFQLSPVGKKAHIQVCGTTPCMLRGSGDLTAVCKRRISHDPQRLSADGAFSWEEVECLGACVNAPLVQVGKDLFEDLTPEALEEILDSFARGETPKAGPRVKRQFSAPTGGPTTLTTPGLYEARRTAATAATASSDVDPAVVERNEPTENVPAEKAGAGEEASPTAIAKSAASAAVDLASGVKVTGRDGAVGDGAAAVDDAAKPAALAGPRDGKADDLKRISGVGPKLEGVLNELGVFHFDQIAAWGPDTVAWVDNFLSFKGRIEREDWIAQAKKLAEE